MSRPLVFLHIPKTSGIAVAHALVAAERPERVFFGFDRSFFGGFTDFASVSAETRAFIHLAPDTLPRGERVVRAHMALSTLRAAYPAARFMTVLREPVCRILSHFVFWRGFSNEHLSLWGGWAHIMMLAQGNLAAFLADTRVACQIDNVAVRLLLWPHRLIPDDGFIAAEHTAGLIEAAWLRLQELEFAAIIEGDEFSARLGAFLGVRVDLERHNVSPQLPAWSRTGAGFTADAFDLLNARTRLDKTLWRRLAEKEGKDAVSLQEAILMHGLKRFENSMSP